MTMNIRMFKYVALAAALAIGWAVSLALSHERSEANERATDDPREVTLAEGRMSLQVPKEWKVIQPSIRIIEAELSIPNEEEGQADGRLTIMSAGGSVDANIDRWIGQFRQPDGSSSADKTKREEIEVAGKKVHMVDIAGTYLDQRGGPGGPTTARDDYRMLGAIVETGDFGNYFIKFYGPSQLVSANQQEFDEFVKSLDVK